MIEQVTELGVFLQVIVRLDSMMIGMGGMSHVRVVLVRVSMQNIPNDRRMGVERSGSKARREQGREEHERQYPRDDHLRASTHGPMIAGAGSQGQRRHADENAANTGWVPAPAASAQLPTAAGRNADLASPCRGEIVIFAVPPSHPVRETARSVWRHPETIGMRL